MSSFRPGDGERLGQRRHPDGTGWRGPGGMCPAGRRGFSPGGVEDLETGATERHKVQTAEHTDYARISALTWKNTQRNI